MPDSRKLAWRTTVKAVKRQRYEWSQQESALYSIVTRDLCCICWWEHKWWRGAKLWDMRGSMQCYWPALAVGLFGCCFGIVHAYNINFAWYYLVYLSAAERSCCTVVFQLLTHCLSHWFLADSSRRIFLWNYSYSVSRYCLKSLTSLSVAILTWSIISLSLVLALSSLARLYSDPSASLGWFWSWLPWALFGSSFAFLCLCCTCLDAVCCCQNFCHLLASFVAMLESGLQSPRCGFTAQKWRVITTWTGKDFALAFDGLWHSRSTVLRTVQEQHVTGCMGSLTRDK